METPNESSENRRDTMNPGNESENRLSNNEDASGNDLTDEGRNERSHHQQFGNRKYESHRNHSANDDQPMTDTGPTGSSPTLT